MRNKATSDALLSLLFSTESLSEVLFNDAVAEAFHECDTVFHIGEEIGLPGVQQFTPGGGPGELDVDAVRHRLLHALGNGGGENSQEVAQDEAGAILHSRL